MLENEKEMILRKTVALKSSTNSTKDLVELNEVNKSKAMSKESLMQNLNAYKASISQSEQDMLSAFRKSVPSLFKKTPMSKETSTKKIENIENISDDDEEIKIKEENKHFAQNEEEKERLTATGKSVRLDTNECDSKNILLLY